VPFFDAFELGNLPHSFQMHFFCEFSGNVTGTVAEKQAILFFYMNHYFPRSGGEFNQQIHSTAFRMYILFSFN
jgi:hypothetical protein